MYRTTNELISGLEHIRQSPKDGGVLKLIVRRPQVDQREVVESAGLDLKTGLVGDNWKERGAAPSVDRQLTLMNIRVIALLSPEEDRWPLAGDQLYLDLDLSAENLPAGSRLALGEAVIEVTAPPHTGCSKFSERFGPEAVQFVNSPVGKELHLRGVNARVVQAGAIRVGDKVRKV